MVSTLIAITNLFIVIQVFKFNRRMSQSKLSVVPSLKAHFLPRSSVLRSQEDIEEEIQKHRNWQDNLDNTYYVNELNFDNMPNRIGLPTLEESLLGIVANETIKTLSVIIKNTGDLPSTNVRIKLLLKTYGTKNFYPKSPLPKELIERELFSEHEISIPIAYIGANDQREFSILHLNGQFRETELILLSIKSNGFTYIKNSPFKNFFRPDSEIILNHYEMDRLKEKITEDSLKVIYGIKKPGFGE